MVASPRALLRSLAAALLAAGLLVLAAAMVTPGGDVVRGHGPAIHPAAEITPNSLPRSVDDLLLIDDGDRLTPGDHPGDPGAASAADGAAPGDHGGPHADTVVAHLSAPVTLTPDDTRSAPVPDGAARPAASAPAGPADGRAPPEPAAA